MKHSITLLNRIAFGTLAACSFICVLVSACQSPPPSDIVLKNGKVATVDEDFAIREAVAIQGDRIVFVGSNQEAESYVGDNTQVIDLAGQLVVPGFIEGHGHYMGLGRAKMILDLTQVRSWQEIVDMVAEAARTAPQNAWILGRGWHQEKWDQAPRGGLDGLPLHASLSKVSPRNPVYLTHASGHASFANAVALELAGIKKGASDPPGGEIVHDRGGGNPTGMLRENAQDAVEEIIAEYNEKRSAEEVEAELRERAELAGAEALSKGVTSFQDAGSSFETIDFLKKLADEGQLPIRLYIMIRYETNDAMAQKLPQYRMINHGNNFLTVRAIKRQLDGALGAHGAWLLEPYEDLPQSAGLNLEPLDEVSRTTELAIQHGYQVNTHAIGDRANREMLDMYEELFKANPDKKDLRWRIEHAQHVHPDDVNRFAELGVIASMQGVHCTSDGPWVDKRLGEKRTRETSYLWRSLWDSGAIVTNGTDVPVEDIDPVASYYSTVTRKMADGRAFHADQKLTREEALKTYTINGAISAFEEDIKGSLEAGKLADLVVLSKDILTVPDEQIKEAKVVYTFLGGKIVYRAEAPNVSVAN
jgi:predicted amidohydrolase YtcJ